jgi:hypothetical protein
MIIFLLRVIKNMNNLEVIKWIKEVTGLDGYELRSGIEVVVSKPYSKVWKIKKNSSSIYFKQVSDQLFLELKIIKTLRASCQYLNVPEIIAENKQLNCFLMKDCGAVNLRDYFKGSFQEDIFKKGLQSYKSMQKSTIGCVDELIDLGVPDWRLEKLPCLYQNIIRNSELLHIIGLEKEKINKLYDFSDEFAVICKELSACSVLECFNNCDLKEENMTYEESIKKVCLIDFSESAICHPFFSLLHSLKGISRRYFSGKKIIKRKELIDLYFGGYCEQGKELQKILGLVNLIYPIYLILLRMHLVKMKSSFLLEGSSSLFEEYRSVFTYFVEGFAYLLGSQQLR